MAARTKAQSIAETERELLFRIRTVGVTAAFNAALAICEDAKAPAPARATASASIFRVAGYFEKNTSDASRKEQHEMSSEELADAIQELEDLAHARARGASDLDDDDEGVDIFN